MVQFKGVERYRYEFIFSEWIDKMREFDVQRDNTDSIITNNIAREIRSLVETQLAVHKDSTDKSVGSAFDNPVGRRQNMSNMDALVGAINSVVTDKGYPAITVSDIEEINEKFDEFTGVSDNDPRDLPISPWDPRFSYHISVMDNGSPKMLADFNTLAGTLRDWDGDLGNINRHYFLSRIYAPDSNELEEEIGLGTYADKAGLGALSPYMTRDELNSLRSWVRDGFFDRREPGMSEMAIMKSVAILDHLRDEGYNLTFHKDAKPGQVKVRLEGVGAEIRLIDLAKNEGYVGRIYQNGSRTNFLSPFTEGSVKSEAYIASIEDSVKAIDYALGKDVQFRGLGDHKLGDNTTIKVRGSQGRVQEYASNYSVRGYNQLAGFDERGKPYYIYTDSRDSSKGAFFRTHGPSTWEEDSKATEFIENAVYSAQLNIVDALDLPQFIDLESKVRDIVDPEDYPEPSFSSDETISGIQHMYWDLITGKISALPKPSKVLDEVNELEDGISEGLSDIKNKVEYFEGRTVDQIIDHAEAYMNHAVGYINVSHYPVSDEDIQEQRNRNRNKPEGEQVWRDMHSRIDDMEINPLVVAGYMGGTGSRISNENDLISALRHLKVPIEQLKGEEPSVKRLIDRTIYFDPETAVGIADHDNDYIRRVGEYIEESLSRRGVSVDAIDIDDAGIVQWRGRRIKSQRRRADGTFEVNEMVGTIGQIFAPDPDVGTITTNYRSGNDKLIVPGLRAYVVPKKFGESDSVYERSRFIGLEGSLIDAIDRTIFNDIQTYRTEVGDPTSLNRVYRDTFHAQHDLDWFYQRAELELEAGENSVEAFLASVETDLHRVRYDKNMKDSGMHAVLQEAKSPSDPYNDNYVNAFMLTDYTDMATDISDERAAYFDHTVRGTNANQNLVHYRVEGTVYDPRSGRLWATQEEMDQGRVFSLEERDAYFKANGIDPDRKTPILDTELMKNSHYDRADRNGTAAHNVRDAQRITLKVGVARAKINGWGMNDGFVISKEFAEKWQIRGVDGNMRPLRKGDKLSDAHFEKGVIGEIIDRDMSPEEAAEKKLENVVAFFAANPNMDVVMSPFSSMGRGTGGGSRDLMENVEDLVLPNGEVVEGGLGYTNILVHDKAADTVTKNYVEENELNPDGPRKGRKGSSQLVWQLKSVGAHQTLRALFGYNNGGYNKTRSYMNVFGIDMDDAGTISTDGYIAPRKKLDEIPVDWESDMMDTYPPHTNPLTSGNVLKDVPAAALNDVADDFVSKFLNKEGFVHLPFELETYRLVSFEDDVDDVVITTPQVSDDRNPYRMYVMPPALRSSQSPTEGGATITHEYMNRYKRIIQEAYKYNYYQEMIDSGQYSDAVVELAKQYQEDAKAAAQSTYSAMGASVDQTQFTGKHNTFKENIMSVSVNQSATSIVSPDPRLDIDQIGISPALAESLGVEEDGHLLIWRDPLIRDNGLKYIRVTLDDTLDGIAMNPVTAKAFDGDFDGDTFALVGINNPSAHYELLDKLTFASNLLDKRADIGIVHDEETGEVLVDETGTIESERIYDLNFDYGLDVQAGFAMNPELGERLEEIRQEVNDIEMDFAQIDKSDPSSYNDIMRDFRHRRVAALREINDIIHKSLDDDTYLATQFNSMNDHMQSMVRNCINTGAKGNTKQLVTYGKYIGAEVVESTLDENGEINELTQWIDVGLPLATKDMDKQTLQSLTAKAQGTGLAGASSQRVARALHGHPEAFRAALNLTSSVTQSMLSAKENGEEAQYKLELVSSTVRDFWDGYVMEIDPDRSTPEYPIWRRARSAGGKETGEKATPDVWVKQMAEFYDKGLKVGYAPDNLEIVASAMYDPEEGTIIGLSDMIEYNIEAYKGSYKDAGTSVLSRCAYQGSRSSLPLLVASEGQPLYTSGTDTWIAPRSVQDAMEEKFGYGGYKKEKVVTHIHSADNFLYDLANGEEMKKPEAVSKEPAVEEVVMIFDQEREAYQDLVETVAKHEEGVREEVELSIGGVNYSIPVAEPPAAEPPAKEEPAVEEADIDADVIDPEILARVSRAKSYQKRDNPEDRLAM